MVRKSYFKFQDHLPNLSTTPVLTVAKSFAKIGIPNCDVHSCVI